jgi:hypothetical protein
VAVFQSGLRRRAAVSAATFAVLSAAAALPASAGAVFSETYGGVNICGSNCYVQSANAHTFRFNEGWSSSGSPALACQLFNGTVNNVSHGNGVCRVTYGGGQFVWARVYNQSGGTYQVWGYAET